MIPGEYNITIYRGSTWDIKFSKKDANDVYIDFQVDYIDQPGVGQGKIEMHIRPAWKTSHREPAGTPLLSLSTATGEITLVNATTIKLELTAAQTEALDFTTGSYDIELVTGDDPEVRDKILYGLVSVKNEKTRG